MFPTFITEQASLVNLKFIAALASTGFTSFFFVFGSFEPGYQPVRDSVLRFSLVATENYWWEEIEAANGKRMTISKIFTEVSRFSKDDASKTINTKTTGGKFTASDFIWVSTVPGVLYDFDFYKQFMIEAATQAGLVTEETRSKVKLVLESEAALAWCLKLPSDGFISQNHSRNSQDQPAGAADADTSCNDPPGSQEAVKFIKEPEETKVSSETQRDGKRYLVVDCGDEFIDTTVHEVSEGKAFKKSHFDYEYYGGRTVDYSFKEFLSKIFSEVWEEYETNFPNEVQKIMFDFRLKSMDEDVQISCSDNSVILAQKQKEIKTFFDSVEGASWDDGSIRISRDKSRSFFDKSLDSSLDSSLDWSLEGITNKLREIINKDYNIGYIVLVGGFAESQILRQHIIDQFGHQYKVSCPLRPQEVISKGAVESGRNPKLVESQ